MASPQGRFAAAAELLDGTGLVAAEAVGKHLLIDFEGGRTVWIHLGLIGKLRFGPVEAVLPQPQTLRLRISADQQAADLRGPQWCRLIDPAERAAVVQSSGPDPLRADADPERAWRKVQASARPIAVLLMDQKVFAGVGNIFRAEVLFRHGIDPLLPAKALRWDARPAWMPTAARSTSTGGWPNRVWCAGLPSRGPPWPDATSIGARPASRRVAPGTAWSCEVPGRPPEGESWGGGSASGENARLLGLEFGIGEDAGVSQLAQLCQLGQQVASLRGRSSGCGGRGRSGRLLCGGPLGGRLIFGGPASLLPAVGVPDHSGGDRRPGGCTEDAHQFSCSDSVQPDRGPRR